MSFHDLLHHTLLVKHPAPDTTPDSTGQLYVDATGQPVGDATIETDWSDAAETEGLVQELSARWPEGPGAGPELVDTRIYLPIGVAVRELDKLKRTDSDPEQVYQAVFVHDAAGQGHHLEIEARRIPL